MVRIVNLQTGNVTNTNRVVTRRARPNGLRLRLIDPVRKFDARNALDVPLSRFQRLRQQVRTVAQDTLFRTVFEMFLFAVLLSTALHFFKTRKKLRESDVEDLMKKLFSVYKAVDRRNARKIFYSRWVETSLLLFLKYAPSIVAVYPIASLFPQAWVTSIAAGVAVRKGINRTSLKPFFNRAETIENGMFELANIAREATKNIAVSVAHFELFQRTLDVASASSPQATLVLTMQSLLIATYRTAYYLALGQAGRVGVTGLVALVKVAFGTVLDLRKAPMRAINPRDIRRLETALANAETKTKNRIVSNRTRR